MIIPIVLTLDKKYTQHLSVMLVSLFENNTNLSFHIYIFSNELDTKDEQITNELIQRYAQNVSFHQINIDSINHFGVHAHVSLATYYRIIVFSLLPDYVDKALYLDLDLLVVKDISFLYNLDIENKLLGVVPEVDEMISQKKILNIPDEKIYFNAGVMLVNIKKWKDEKWTEKVIEYINMNPEKIEFWDQDALNALCYDECIYMDKKWNMQAGFFQKKYKDNFVKTVIIHFTGSSKPWQYMNKHIYKKIYYQYLKKTDFKNYTPPDKSIGNFFRKYKLMPKFYDKLFEKKK